MSNYTLNDFENTKRTNQSDMVNYWTTTKTNRSKQSLNSEVSDKLKENVEFEVVEKEMDLQFKDQIDEMNMELELAEKLLVDAMEEYVAIEEEVWNIESHDINVHYMVQDLMRDYQQIYEDIEKEKSACPLTVERLCDLDKEIKLETQELQNVTAEKDLKNKILKENIEGLEKEYKLALENQLNIQVLNEKPYLTAISVDFDKVPSYSTENISAQNNYFETVELFSQLKIDEKDYKFNKVIRNEEIEYFIQPHLRHQLGFRKELVKYMIEYITWILQFIRRIQQPNSFYKGSFKDTKPDEEIKKEMEINLMNRKITIIFMNMDHSILEAILDGLHGIIGDNSEDVTVMIEHLLSPLTGGINRVNLLTPNLDGSWDWEVEIIVTNPRPASVEEIMESVIKNCQDNKRMVNLFINVDPNETPEGQKKTAEILDLAIPYWDKYVTANSLLFFF